MAGTVSQPFEPNLRRSRQPVPTIQIPRGLNSEQKADVNYPVLFVGMVIVAIVIYVIRARDMGVITGPVVNLVQSPYVDTSNILNTANRVGLQASGAYNPQGSAMGIGLGAANVQVTSH